ncbi:MAG: UDP-N-acetylmuramoyl-tripeptide--D-alanyl-D-alanine ligase [Bacteroidales bacterium]|nr:UDP-N-acetylmuramoyl-tripeptide--D-alanyl-D-alanine ligase [Bacteroidales bacterium]MDD4669783.1 UDP-N-acetylmuramoyl-tripeptide--D-alanyl-D-alanine ligase [Bacteroidales bacterium]
MKSTAEIYSFYRECSGITTDSRNITENVMFFALKGDKFDGNDFAIDALKAGAKYAVVDRPALADEDSCRSGRLIIVPDVLKTLQLLASYHRNQFDIPVIAITGTNGKTTTKELVNAVLSTKYNVVATQGNLNNHIGVPLTLFRLNSETQIAVVEMGASAPGEIKSSVETAHPGYGLVSNVGKAHLLGFGSFDGVKKTKGELYDYLQQHNGVAFYNEDNPHLREMISERNLKNTVKYGLNYSKSKILAVSADSPFLRVQLSLSGDTSILDEAAEQTIVNTHLVGGYNADNLLAALCVGRYFNVPLKDAVRAIENYIPSNNRSQMVRTSGNLLIVDAYNANPTSMRASLDNFSNTEFQNKTLILGDMLELGADSTQEHKTILEAALRVCDKSDNIFLVGREFKKAAEESSCSNIKLFSDSEALKTYFEAHPLVGRTILVKGSNGIRLEKLLPAL